MLKIVVLSAAALSVAACTTTGNCTLTTSGQAGATSTLLDPDGDGTDNYLIPDSQIDAYLAARAND